MWIHPIGPAYGRVHVAVPLLASPRPPGCDGMLMPLMQTSARTHSTRKPHVRVAGVKTFSDNVGPCCSCVSGEQAPSHSKSWGQREQPGGAADRPNPQVTPGSLSPPPPPLLPLYPTLSLSESPISLCLTLSSLSLKNTGSGTQRPAICFPTPTSGNTQSAAPFPKAALYRAGTGPWCRLLRSVPRHVTAHACAATLLSPFCVGVKARHTELASRDGSCRGCGRRTALRSPIRGWCPPPPRMPAYPTSAADQTLGPSTYRAAVGLILTRPNWFCL